MITLNYRKMAICRIYSGRKAEGVAEYLREYPAVYIITDKNTENFAAAVAKSLPENFRGTFTLEADELGKTMDNILKICAWLLENHADRNAMLLGIGGGITTDMTGFTASIYKRGIRFAYLPTTFLAQVDAAIGGKTGVNFENYKNILGVIRQPEFTYVGPEVLGTLTYRDFLSGAAELVKTFIIDDSGDNYEKAVTILSKIHDATDHTSAIASHHAELEELIAAAAKVKAGVVERDEFEMGERRKLNLGHTFAHAIEWEAHNREQSMGEVNAGVHGISHGEAVAMGMIMAAEASEYYYADDKSQPIAVQGLAKKLTEDFRRCGLPVECPYPITTLAEAMKKDKKSENGIVHFILIRAIGDVRIEDLPVDDVVSWISK